MTQLFPGIVPVFSFRGFIQEFTQHYDGKVPIYVADSFRPSFIFYSGLTSNQIKRPDSLARLLDKAGKTYFIVKKKDYDKLPPALQSEVRVLAIQEDKFLFVHEFD